MADDSILEDTGEQRIDARELMDALTSEQASLTEKILLESSKNLWDLDKIYMIADLTLDGMLQTYRLLIIDELFIKRFVKPSDSDRYNKITKLVSILLQLTVSKNRQGRKEVIQMHKELQFAEKELEVRKGFLRR